MWPQVHPTHDNCIWCNKLWKVGEIIITIIIQPPTTSIHGNNGDLMGGGGGGSPRRLWLWLLWWGRIGICLQSVWLWVVGVCIELWNVINFAYPTSFSPEYVLCTTNINYTDRMNSAHGWPSWSQSSPSSRCIVIQCSRRWWWWAVCCNCREWEKEETPTTTTCRVQP